MKKKKKTKTTKPQHEVPALAIIYFPPCGFSEIIYSWYYKEVVVVVVVSP